MSRVNVSLEKDVAAAILALALLVAVWLSAPTRLPQVAKQPRSLNRPKDSRAIAVRLEHELVHRPRNILAVKNLEMFPVDASERVDSGFATSRPANVGVRGLTWARSLDLNQLADIDQTMVRSEQTPAGSPLTLRKSFAPSEERIVTNCNQFLRLSQRGLFP
jgi:hypothetical protein